MVGVACCCVTLEFSVHCVQRVTVLESIRRFGIQNEYYRRRRAIHHSQQPSPAGTFRGSTWHLPNTLVMLHSTAIS